MNVVLIWLGLLAAVMVLLGVCALCLWLERKLPIKKYDERQQEARNKSYRFGFWIGVVYYFVLWIFLASEDTGSWDVASCVLAGFLLQLVAAQIYMLLTGSALPFSQKPIAVAVLCLSFMVNGITYLCRSIDTVKMEQAFFGRYSVPWTSLIISVAMLTLGILYFVEFIRIKKVDKEDD